MTLGFRARIFLLCLLAPFQSVICLAVPDSAPPKAITESVAPEERGLSSKATPLLKEFCFKCHSERRAKGGLNLETAASTPDFAKLFRTWDKVISRLDAREMPPEDESQPTVAQRAQLISTVRESLNAFIQREAGDPGRVALRRLTSAEYAYSIKDLTGLDLSLERIFNNDAVGGEGFSNVGDVQFIQDSSLERYLEAAKIVASHAVIGAGQLRFAPDPGHTGQEISGVQRIQQIYLQHGFRNESGEGGLGFGLDHYPKAFYVAWRYDHRVELGAAHATLATLAHAESLDAPFVEHVWNKLHDDSLAFPSSEISRAWRALPGPQSAAAEETQIRARCHDLYKLLDLWQTTFAENTGEAEVATVFTENGFHPSLTNSFRIRLAWPAGLEKARFQLTVIPVSGKAPHDAAILWREPALRFRKQGNVAVASDAKLKHGTPLHELVTTATAENLHFGVAQIGESIGTNDFVTTGALNIPIEFAIPQGATQAFLTLDAQLIVTNHEDSLVRCVVSHELNEGATVAATGTFSLLLANPDGANIGPLIAGVTQLARTFPQISHREADPADRDPIPAPFDNGYNNVERNEFHARLKYFRDDRFLTEHILEADAQHDLENAWVDVLTAFEYHNMFARFVAKKFHLDIANLNLATLARSQINQIPAEPREYIQRLQDEYLAAHAALHAAESGHLEDTLRFAELAWRRPLDDSEKNRLRLFYARMRSEDQNHPTALRALLARVLVAPGFLYRLEPLPAASPEAASSSPHSRIPLSDRELATRLSYFLWSSIPDEELSRAAAAGEFKSVGQLSRQAERMLHDAKARRFATEFFGQWFGFYRFDGYRGVDTQRFNEFTDDLRRGMYDEAVSFFEYVVREDRPVHEILFADYSFLNRGLALHYGVTAPDLPTNHVVRVGNLSPFHRGGLLRFGAVLTSTSAPLRTSAVKRGDWILRRVLGRGVPPPPGDAGSIPPDDVLADGKTVRQRLEAHRRNPSCVNCHARMDALGFSLEHFDSIGRWRDAYRDGQPIDASGKLNDGAEIAEFEGLNEYLLKNEDLFNRTLCAKLLGFALGRAELASDRPLLAQMADGLKRDNRLSTLILQIVESPQFRFRHADPASAEPKRIAAQ